MLYRFVIIIISYLFMHTFAVAAECSNVFTDGIQNNSNSGYLTFYASAKVINSPDNILDSKRSIVDYSGGGNCDGTSCGSSGSIAQSVAFNDFINNSNDIYLVTGEQTIFPGDYNNITLGSGSKLTLTAGDYKLNGHLTLYSSSQIKVSGNGVVRVFVKESFTIYSGSEINTAGNSTKLLLYGKNDINFHASAKVTASVYSKENVYLNSGAVVNGSISGKNVTLFSSSTVNFNRSEPDFSDFCSGSPSAILVSDWRMDEDAWQGNADELIDSSGNNYHGNAVSASTSSGFICNAADLSATGTDDYLSLDYSAINGLKDFTLSAWVNTTRTGGQAIMSVANSTQFNEAVFYYENNSTSWPTLRESSFNSSTKITVSNISTGSWKHHVWTRKTNANNGELCLYIDNVLQGCSTHNNGEFAIGVDPTGFILGQEQDSLGGGFDSSQAFSGLLDEVLLFDGILSTTEINEINNNQIQGKNWDGSDRSCGPIEPIADWRMDEDTWQGSAGEVIDDSGNGYHGEAVSTTPIDGFICNAADLSATGTDDYLSLDHTAIDGLKNFTVSAWVKTSRTGGQALVSVANSTQFNEALFFYGNNTTFYPTIRESSFNPSTQNPVSNISTDSWQHHVWIRKTYVNNGEVCLYIDNVFEGCSTHNNGEFAIDVDATGFILGQEQDSVGGGFDSSQAFSGLLDEVLLFDMALSVNDIDNIYTNQVQGKNWDGTERTCGPPQPIAEWRMDEASWSGSAEEVVDETGSFNAQAINGAKTENATPALVGNPGTCGYGVFDGVNDYLALPPSFENQQDSFTITAWIKPSNLDAGSRIFADDESNTQGYAFSLGDPGSGKLRFYSRGVSPISVDTLASVIPTDTWTFVAAVHNSKTKTREIYVNGVAQSVTGGGLSSTYSGTWGVDTGIASIGGETNSGETSNRFTGAIDEVRMYEGALSASEITAIKNETHPCSILIDHFEIDTIDGLGLTCQADDIIIKACADSTCTTLNTDEFTVELFVTAAGNTTSKGTTTFSGGSVSTNYVHTTIGNAALSLDQGYACKNSSGTPCDVDFRDAGFEFSTITDQVAGIDFQGINIQAVKDINGVCTDLLSGNKSVDMAIEYVAPSRTTVNKYFMSATVIAKNLLGNVNNYTAVPLNFVASSIADLGTNKYDDAGQIKLYARYVEPPSGTNAGFTIEGASNAFWVSPHHFSIVASNTNGPLIGITHDSIEKQVSGKDFTLSIITENFDGDATTNYIAQQPQLQLERTGPTSGTAEGRLQYSNNKNILSELNADLLYKSASEVIFDLSGEYLFNAATYSEVGLTKLYFRDANYGSGSYKPEGSANIGRFYPDHFVINIDTNGELAAYCDNESIPAVMDFAYSGQMSTASSNTGGVIRYSLNPSFIITAKSLDAVNTTKNYTGDFMRLLGSSITRKTITQSGNVFYLPILDGSQDGSQGTRMRLVSDLKEVTTSDLQANENSGDVTYVYNNFDNFVYTHDLNAEFNLFSSDINLPIESVIDPDGVTALDADDFFDPTNALNTVFTLEPAGIEVRFGRAYLENSYGPETSTLPQVFSVEYFKDGQYILAENDICSLYNTDKVSFGTLNEVSLDEANIVPVDGKFDDVLDPPDGLTRQIVLPAAGTGNQGSVEVIYTIYDWLKYDWAYDNEGVDGLYNDNPHAIATFGIFRGNDRIIYQREIQR